MHNNFGFGYDFDPRQDARLYLGAGVTTIRTAGTYEPYREINLKRDAHKGSIRSIRRATPLSPRSARSSHAMSRLRRPWRKQRLTNRVVLPLTHASVT